MIQSFDKDSELRKLLNQLIRGPTIELPHDEISKKHPHRKSRVQWWNNQYNSWQSLLVAKNDLRRTQNLPLPQGYFDHLASPSNNKPIFFGHYWFQGTPKILSKNIAGLDYSACIGGQLVAYDWRAKDEPKKNGLRNDRFVMVKSTDFRDYLS